VTTQGRLRFQAGGTLREGSIYIERPADQELFETLLRGDFCYVLSTRQIGKSSLRLRVSKRLASEGIACVSIDLSGAEIAQSLRKLIVGQSQQRALTSPNIGDDS
jgi:hypothetical protein